MRLSVKLSAVCLLVLMLVMANLPAFAAPKNPIKQETDNIVKTAEKYLKAPYRFGGESPKGFDCSGFVKYVYDRHGKKLPRTADVQYVTGKKVDRSSLKPGDLVFFNTYASGASHVGIYYDNGRFIHASSSRGVMISRLDEPYWKPRYLGARRIIN
ncbi:C40 family peptidase [Sporomusa sp.]|uniref:C40 family peptidase n=1 Tax=Sporomusa sp. TaxID=2078658 RepID=UPI002CD7A234|nr:C40 family peptidase [Sporomusa sp.]HWR42992.1 C40 family peptidase [Sporomusa sp.]